MRFYRSEPDPEAEARARAHRMACFDALPPNVRAAIRDCTFYVDILVPTRGLNWDMMVDKINGLSTYEQAREFTRVWGRTSGGNW